MPTPLPIDDILPKLADSLRRNPCAVLQAPTGAGKTTRVPPALLAAGLAGTKQIVMLEPRRIAARGAALRMAAEANERVGSKIGYAVRFDRQAGANTRILVVTPGILLRMLQEDPYLEQVGVLVFDEFHERGLESDLALGLAKLLRETVNPDLKIVVMSATLDAENASKYLGSCPILTSEGRMFPVEIRHRAPRDDDSLDEVLLGIEELLEDTPGDLLVFLPDVNDIRRTSDALEPLARQHDLLLFPLYGDLPPDKQDQALKPQERRRIVIATNVAETSVTVEGVTGVIDTGTAWQMIYDPAVGLDRLRKVSISRASAEQRTGRAGRTQPGVCLRLWSELDHRARAAQTEPEIKRVDLASAVLHLIRFGETEPLRFPWLDAPQPAAVRQALDLLEKLGAVERTKMTRLGETLARLPVHPRLARLLVEGRRTGCAEEAALAAALLSERDPFPRGDRNRKPAPTASDLHDKLEGLKRYEASGDYGNLNRAAIRNLFQVRNQFARLLAEEGNDLKPGHLPLEEALGRSLLAAYPDRLCRRRTPGGAKGLMTGGRGVMLLHTSGVVQNELFLALDIDAGEGETRVRMAHGVERDWLPREWMSDTRGAEWDGEGQLVRGVKRIRCLDLVLDESPGPLPSDAEVAAILIEKMSADWEKAIPSADTDAGQFLLRWQCLNEWLPDAGLPKWTKDLALELGGWLAPGRKSFAELRNADWLNAIRQKIGSEAWNLIEREAPEKIEVPSGSRIKLAYEPGRPPVLAVRIQELFGMTETPRIARGKVSVLMHLLAPNYRPQQVTEDLASFWKNTYPLVRKELRTRYPKHSWPDDPYTAEARARPGRKKD